MASNITSAAVFATANMKPDPGEQADALWAQKIAENTGALWFRKIFGPHFGFHQPASAQAGTYRGTYFFEKTLGMGTFQGSFVGSAAASGPTITIHMNGTSIFSQNASGTLYQTTIGTDLVGITDGAMVAVGWRAIVPSGAGECNFAFTGWQKQ